MTQNLPFHSPLSFDADHSQLQMLEKLKQLREWQIQQQKHLLLQQQHELLALRNNRIQGTNESIPPLDVSVNYEEGHSTLIELSGENLQPSSHTDSSGSSLHSTDSGMLSASGSTIDILKRQQSEGVHVSPTQNDRITSNLLVADNNIPHDDQPVKPGIGPGNARTFEELLEAKLKQYENTSSCFLPSPRPLIRCPSEDSFLIRKEHRRQTEKDELVEFELLERAANEMSFSSQCSLVARAFDSSHISSSPKTCLAVTNRKRDGRSLSLSPVQTQTIKAIQSHKDVPQCNIPASTVTIESPALPSLHEEEDNVRTSVDERFHFNDVDVWDESVITENSFDVKPVSLAQNDFKTTESTKCAVPVRKVKVLSSEFKDDQPHQDDDDEDDIYSNVNRPSTLVANLFPALKRDLPSTVSCSSSVMPPEPQMVHPVTCNDNDDHQSELNLQIKEKLKQLESEINRFKSENANLTRIRNDKEQGLVQLKKQISDFTKEKEEEVDRFEKYKIEELKKLKKERHVFEMYQREIKSHRDKKDKEEILTLKIELDRLRDEMSQKEQRWSTTLSRYRLRIESLEAQNQELQNDLKMIEEQRLIQWKQQLISKHNTNINTKSSKTKTPNEAVTNKRTKPVASCVQLMKEKKENEYGKPSLCPDKLQESSIPKDVSEMTQSPIKAINDVEMSFTAGDISSSSCSSSSSGDHVMIVDVPANDVMDSCLSDKANEIISEIFSDDDDNDNNDDDNGIQSAYVDDRLQDTQSVAACEGQLAYSHTTNTSIESKANKIKESKRGEDGSTIILYHNGTRKVISNEGKSSTIYFFNGDVKCTQADGTIVYYYSCNNTTHTTHPDGTEVWEFSESVRVIDD
jgi:hypothetical protein